MSKLTNQITNSFLLDVISEAPYGVIVFDSSGKIILENALALTFLHISDLTILNQSIEKILLVPELQELIIQVLEGERERFDIMEMHFLDNVLTLRCRRTDNWSILTVQDITRWKQIEMSSVQSIIEMQEVERQRIAREMHDGVGPQISSAVHNLEAIQAQIQAENPAAGEKLDAVIHVVSDISNELRAISHSLMPRVLLDYGLVAALEGLVDRINSSQKCAIEFINAFKAEINDQAVELNLYRIAQELINNALKHAKATKIYVQLIKSEDGLILMVEDNGSGFNILDLQSSDGIGLSNIEMRTKVLGGELNIDSAPERGTIFTIEVSL